MPVRRRGPVGFRAAKKCQGETMGRKIAIVGAGAVGGYAGAHMVQAGEDVTFIDPWVEDIEKMREDGLRVTHARDVAEFSVPVRALHVTDAQLLAKETPVDIAFVCMKSYDTAWATTLIQQYLAPDGYVVSLQNCMNEETIAGIVGWGKTLGCIASSITVNLPEPGHIHRGAVERAGEGDGAATRACDEQRFKDGKRTSSEQRPSMGQDMQKGRRTEIEFLNGFVVREGKKVGLPCSANAVLTDIVKRVERNELSPDPRHITELRLN